MFLSHGGHSRVHCKRENKIPLLFFLFKNNNLGNFQSKKWKQNLIAVKFPFLPLE